MNKQVKVLVIDDDPYICDLIILYAEKSGYKVSIANDGMTGLEMFYESPPDLVILDIMLPEMDGWEVCKEIRKFNKTPIIMLTGKGESHDKLKGFNLGTDDYMVKPFDPKELMVRIKAVLRRANPTLDANEIGAVACFLVLAITGLNSEDAQMVRASYLVMELTASYVIVPLSLASLLTGIVMSLGTQWGLFRYYWVLVKLLLTVLATIVLLLQMGQISYIAEVAAESTLSSIDFREARLSLLVHAGGGLLVLLVISALSVYKPRGVTRYGQRKQHERMGSYK